MYAVNHAVWNTQKPDQKQKLQKQERTETNYEHIIHLLSEGNEL